MKRTITLAVTLLVVASWAPALSLITAEETPYTPPTPTAARPVLFPSPIPSGEAPGTPMTVAPAAKVASLPLRPALPPPEANIAIELDVTIFSLNQIRLKTDGIELDKLLAKDSLTRRVQKAAPSDLAGKSDDRAAKTVVTLREAALISQLLKAARGASIIAAPTVRTRSGQQATLQVKGEFPVLAPSTVDSFSVRHLDYGTKLEVLPELTDGGVRLELSVTHKAIDEDSGIKVEGQTIPALKSIELKDTVDLKPGQTAVLGPPSTPNLLIMVRPTLLLVPDESSLSGRESKPFLLPLPDKVDVDLGLTKGKSTLIQLPYSAVRVIQNPTQIVDILAVKPNVLKITAQKVGVTNIDLFSDEGHKQSLRIKVLAERVRSELSSAPVKQIPGMVRELPIRRSASAPPRSRRFEVPTRPRMVKPAPRIDDARVSGSVRRSALQSQAALPTVLDELFPGADIKVKPLTNSVVLQGKIDRNSMLAAIKIAEDYYPQVINMLEPSDDGSRSITNDKIETVHDEVKALRQDVQQLIKMLEKN